MIHLPEVRLLHSDQIIDWQTFDNRWLLFCNVARLCQLSQQIAQLQRLQRHFPQRLQIFAIPCNQFFGQEPGSREELCTFYDHHPLLVTEPMEVNGSGSHSLYQTLKAKQASWPTTIFWNYTKFLIDPERQSVLRFSPLKTPQHLHQWLEQIPEPTTKNAAGA